MRNLDRGMSRQKKNPPLAYRLRAIPTNLAAQIFKHCGYEVTVSDPVQARRELARNIGLGDIRETISADPASDLDNEILLHLECSGHEQAVLDGCRLIRQRGEVVLLGVPWRKRTEIPAFDLLHAVFHRYAHLRSGWEWEIPATPQAFHNVSIRQNTVAALQWLADGHISVSGLAELYSPRDAAGVYDGLRKQTLSTPGAIFDWRQLKVTHLMAIPPTLTQNASSTSACRGQDVFGDENLLAWCIVPFDPKSRSPRERAEMLQRVGLKRYAYDYRSEHVPSFPEELDVLAEHGIELTACMILGNGQDSDSQAIVSELTRRNLYPQLWCIVECSPEPAPILEPSEQDRRVEEYATMLQPLADATAASGHRVALYNHGGWFGEPENQIQIIEKLGAAHFGIVYNFHHGHAHIPRFASLWATAQPHVLAVNLNGMIENGDRLGKKILPLGQGDRESQLIEIIAQSGWRGPVGLLNHTECDPEARLLDNLEGLHRIRDGSIEDQQDDQLFLRSWNGADITP